MADRKYYVLCDSNCKFESMTKEQILTAITQAVQTGKVGDCDTGFITSVKTINGFPLRFFVGTQSEYESLGESQKRNLFAIITNDTSKEALFDAIEGIRSEFDAFKNGIAEGRIVVPKAKNDGDGNEIAKTYAHKDSVVKTLQAVQTSVAIGTYYTVGALPDGKTIVDIVGIEVSNYNTTTYKTDFVASALYIPRASANGYAIVELTGSLSQNFGVDEILACSASIAVKETDGAITFSVLEKTTARIPNGSTATVARHRESGKAVFDKLTVTLLFK
jgi:hypothetical protein